MSLHVNVNNMRGSTHEMNQGREFLGIQDEYNIASGSVPTVQTHEHHSWSIVRVRWDAHHQLWMLHRAVQSHLFLMKYWVSRRSGLGPAPTYPSGGILRKSEHETRKVPMLHGGVTPASIDVSSEVSHR